MVLRGKGARPKSIRSEVCRLNPADMPKRPKTSYFRDPPLPVFGARVRTLRLAHGWSQEQLAHGAERHFTYVSSIERGERNATLLTVLRLADALAVHPAVLVTTDEALFQAAAAKAGSDASAE